jgi:hypothetical protein
MEKLLEAEIALLHIAAGAPRITPPPGTLALTPPRRSARGRSKDFLLLSVSLTAPSTASPGLVDHLARLASDAYYGTPGSVTSALREAAKSINDHLVDVNQNEEGSQHWLGHMMAAVLREGDLYIAQCGRGQAALVRPGQVTRFISEEVADHPLGLTLAPDIRYHHLEAHVGDLLILTNAPPPLWSDTTLSGLFTLTSAQAMDRLLAVSGQDLTGVLARFVRQGEAGTVVEGAASRRPVESVRTPPTETREVRTSSIRRSQPRPSLKESSGYIRTSQMIESMLAKASLAFRRIVVRMAPGLAEPSPTAPLSPSLMIITAIAVPLIVVAIAAVAYFGRGRRQQFQEYVLEAAAAIQVAGMRSNAADARADWETALTSLQLAEQYGRSNEADAMRQQAQDALDALDLVFRIDFQPVVSGGFSPEALITSIAATSTDLYVLDAAHRILWHAFGAPERGYDLDLDFECINGPDSYPEVGPLVDIVIQEEPGALGAEGVVSVDQDGTLLYCAPERQPAIAQLTPPDTGWGRIQAIDVEGDNLFILDVENNAVWIYNAIGGLFSGNPEIYFVEEVRDLSGAIDLAMAADELIVLYVDGHLDRCARMQENALDGTYRIRVECDPNPTFQDDRPEQEAATSIPGALPIEMTYKPPPEPSLFFQDTLHNRIYHYSLRLVFQGQYIPIVPFEDEITALSIGPPNDIFVAVGTQVYHAIPTR